MPRVCFVRHAVRGDPRGTVEFLQFLCVVVLGLYARAPLELDLDSALGRLPCRSIVRISLYLLCGKTEGDGAAGAQAAGPGPPR